MTFTSYSLSVTVLISICFFSSSDPKGHVSFCRHLLSVVFTFQSSPLKLSSTWSVGTKLCRNIVRKVLYKKKSSFHFDRTKHIATLFVYIGKSETGNACGNHVCCPIKMKWSSFVEDLPNTIPTMLGFNR
jgi:hypothetical protein